MNTYSRLAICLSLLGTLALCADKRMPIPDDATQRSAEMLIKEVFSAELQQTKPADRIALAQKIIRLADESKNDPSTYSQYKQAIDLAVKAGDPATAYKAAEALSAVFAVDSVDLRAEVLLKCGTMLPTKEAAWAVADLSIKTCEDAIATVSLDKFKALVTLIEQAAAKAGDAAFTTRARELSTQSLELMREWPAYKDGLAKLKTNPDDPAGNAACGKFLALVKGDWEQALPLLAKGSDAMLKTAATKELSAEDAAGGAADAGNAWWDYAEKLTGSQKTRLRTHAAGLYQIALPTATGAAKLVMDKRISDVQNAGGTISMGPAKVIRFGDNKANLPYKGANTFNAPITRRTWEAFLLPGDKDGTLIEEGGGGNGMALAVIGSEIHVAVRSGGTMHEYKAAFKARKMWTHVAAQFDAGKTQVWVNGELAIDQTAPISVIPGHGDGLSLGCNGGSPGGYESHGTLTCMLSSFRISSSIRYKAPFRPVPLTLDKDAIAFLDAKMVPPGKWPQAGVPDGADKAGNWELAGNVTVGGPNEVFTSPKP